MIVVREYCAENLTHVAAAIDAGASRIELCDNLAVGGTTPSVGVIREAVALCHERGASVMCMIRPRGDDFAYSPAEARIMRADLLTALEAGVDGVVFGCVRDGLIDTRLTEQLCQLAADAGVGRGGASLNKRAGLNGGASQGITFHMAFDALAPERRLDAIDYLADLGVSRILTHGGPAGSPIEGNLGRLRSYVERARGRIGILPGGGVTWENAAEIAAALGVREVHGTRIVRLG